MFYSWARRGKIAPGFRHARLSTPVIMKSTNEYRVLFRSPILQLAYIGWRGRRDTLSQENSYGLAEITLQRRGMFFKAHGPHRVACDPNTLLFIKADEPYRLAHPADLDCSCTALYLSREIVAQILRQAGASKMAIPDGSFGFDDAPTTPEFTLRHFDLLARLGAFGSSDPLAIEECALALAADIVQASTRFHCARVRPIRPETQRASRQTADAVKELLSQRFAERVTLSDIATAVHAAPTHLCRLFKKETGVPIHRYLTRLRLARSVEYLVDSKTDLSTLALRLGFVHHSHFTEHFRREFGFPPSQLRRARTPHQIGKILTA